MDDAEKNPSPPASGLSTINPADQQRTVLRTRGGMSFSNVEELKPEGIDENLRVRKVYDFIQQGAEDDPAFYQQVKDTFREVYDIFREVHKEAKTASPAIGEPVIYVADHRFPVAAAIPDLPGQMVISQHQISLFAATDDKRLRQSCIRGLCAHELGHAVNAKNDATLKSFGNQEFDRLHSVSAGIVATQQADRLLQDIKTPASLGEEVSRVAEVAKTATVAAAGLAAAGVSLAGDMGTPLPGMYERSPGLIRPMVYRALEDNADRTAVKLAGKQPLLDWMEMMRQNDERQGYKPQTKLGYRNWTERIAFVSALPEHDKNHKNQNAPALIPPATPHTTSTGAISPER